MPSNVIVATSKTPYSAKPRSSVIAATKSRTRTENRWVRTAATAIKHRAGSSEKNSITALQRSRYWASINSSHAVAAMPVNNIPLTITAVSAATASKMFTWVITGSLAIAVTQRKTGRPSNLIIAQKQTSLLRALTSSSHARPAISTAWSITRPPATV